MGNYQNWKTGVDSDPDGKQDVVVGNAMFKPRLLARRPAKLSGGACCRPIRSNLGRGGIIIVHKCIYLRYLKYMELVVELLWKLIADFFLKI